MPQKEHLPRVSDKEQRMYEHIKKSELEQGRSKEQGEGDRGRDRRQAPQRERSRERPLAETRKGSSAVLLRTVELHQPTNTGRRAGRFNRGRYCARIWVSRWDRTRSTKSPTGRDTRAPFRVISAKVSTRGGSKPTVVSRRSIEPRRMSGA